jgi:hypothetical protein
VSIEPEPVSETLRRIRDEVRDQETPARTGDGLFPPAREIAPARPANAIGEAIPPAQPTPPDAGPVNAAWDVRLTARPSGWRRRLAALFRSLVAPLAEQQAQFNARQVQLDNQILEYLHARLDLTHRHYDAVLGVHGRHMQEIDQRHSELQSDVVAHVHDLVRRIDLVLAEGERSRVALEAALRDVRSRLRAIEERSGTAPTK